MKSTTLPQLFQALIDEVQANIGPSAHPVSASGPHDERLEDSRRSLDEELQALQRASEAIATYALKRMLENRSQRNRLSLIHQLPAEILSTIFSLAVRDKRGRQSFHDITLISSVCRLWRGIINDNSPAFWTELCTLPTQLVNIFLTRSRAVPLEIEFDRTHNTGVVHFSDFLRLVLPQLHRWKICRFVLHDRKFDKEAIASFLQHTSTSASQLEILDLQLKTEEGLPNRLVVSHHPFAGATLQLRNLTLDGILVPLEAPIFKGLTRLTLRHISYPDPESIYQLLRVLEASPLLEAIDFTNLRFLPIPSFAPEAHGISVIRLPELRRIIWGEDDYRQQGRYQTLSHIVTPASCFIGMCPIVTPDGDLYQILPLQSVDSTNLPNLVTTNDLTVGLDDRDSCALQAWGPAGVTFIANLIGVGEEESEEFCPRIISNLGRVFPMPVLEALELEFCDGMEGPALVAEFAEFLRIHPTITRVKLVGAAHTLMDLFVIASTRRLCPLLQKLHLVSCPSFGKAVLLDLVASRTSLVAVSGTRDIAPLRDVVLDQCRFICNPTITLLRTRVTLLVLDEPDGSDNLDGSEQSSEGGSTP
ncbi:hypothetical protein BOTBODRAFT_26517 [Botryobasidium botryosum FD-172 SS1]|uniref:F-box domain-containing protein n=1 Tax=Botryobasidium botryosum (strain FD-172 SS1) TaxID=930990 RepID=A0A067N8P3_BOTB1|nr:hypothetical protein BOTBODRAFT_26517 [Botryobasidium botryosum FD-172 SS1]